VGIAILKSERVIVVLRGAVPSDMADHIRNGFPQYIPDLPILIAVEYPDDVLPPIGPPPPPTPEELAATEAEIFQNALLCGTTKVLLNHENRILKLEAKPAITMEQFKTTLKKILDI